MWVYYIWILLSVVMFGGSFALNDIYRKQRGSGLKISMEAACIGALAGCAALLVSGGFALACTPFTLLMATCAALDAIAFTFCSFRALDYVNLSLFSLFAMLGGMALPFLQGILFYGEGFTIAKGVSVLFICIALICTVERGSRKKGTVYYIGVFLLNGTAGVLSKLFTESDLPKTSVTEYSVWVAIVSIVLSGGAWIALALLERHRGRAEAVTGKVRLRSCGVCALNGVVNKLANLLLVFALVHVDASVQYPMVTGGTMIVSTVLSCFGSRKPSKREILSVALAFVGMLSLFIIPV